ncbi:MAG: LysR family transcriptional regulator [Clostridia bacterium]|nr:LysR family transcriptional regulator [Clostridia bacterium]
MDDGLQKYRAFKIAAEAGSFTRAAERMNYTQSGVSRMIAELESDWRLSLLERSKSGVRLTSDGTVLLPRVNRLLEEAEKLQMEIDSLNGLQSGLIRIGTFSSAATYWLPNIIREFQKDYPNIGYEILLGDYTEIEDWVLSGTVDCGFNRLPTSPELEEIFLEQDRLVAILPEAHPLTAFDRVPLSALCDEPFMLLEKGAKAEVSEIFERNRLQPNVHFTTWDDYAVMSMVEAGLGISIVPELILKRAPYRIAVRELDVPAIRRIGLTFRSRKDVSAAVRKFMEYLPYR